MTISLVPRCTEARNLTCEFVIIKHGLTLITRHVTKTIFWEYYQYWSSLGHKLWSIVLISYYFRFNKYSFNSRNKVYLMLKYMLQTQHFYAYQRFIWLPFIIGGIQNGHSMDNWSTEFIKLIRNPIYWCCNLKSYKFNKMDANYDIFVFISNLMSY